jgi:hypothetical protein
VSQKPFVVFACGACGRKIFAERSQQGQRGACPLCGAPTVIGGTGSSRERAVERSAERRRSKRVPIANAFVACETKTGEGRVANADLMPSLEDISESGVAFRIKGETDGRKLGGWGPPKWIKIGETVSVTLHIPQLFRPRQLKAVVKRVVPVANRRELFKVGCEFSAADELVLRDLKKLLEAKSTDGER